VTYGWNQVRTGAAQAFVKEEMIAVEIEAEGSAGTDYSYTIGTGVRAVLELLRGDELERFAPGGCAIIPSLTPHGARRLAIPHDESHHCSGG
jgi:hypothetical protein